MSTPSPKMIAGIDITFIDEKLQKIEILQKVSKQINVPAIYLVGGVFSAVILVLVFLFGAAAVTNLVGFVYPVYMSFKALKSNEGDNDDNTQWLSYWTVYGTLDLAENFLFLDLFIPMYSLLKLALLVFCMRNNGATKIYEICLRPVFLKCEVHIDAFLEKAESVGAQALAEAEIAGKAALAKATAAAAAAGVDVIPGAKKDL